MHDEIIRTLSEREFNILEESWQLASDFDADIPIKEDGKVDFLELGMKASETFMRDPQDSDRVDTTIYSDLIETTADMATRGPANMKFSDHTRLMELLGDNYRNIAVELTGEEQRTLLEKSQNYRRLAQATREKRELF